jgi:SEC-C motif
MSLVPSFVPSPLDIEGYKRLRRRVPGFNHKIVKTIPKEAILEIGDALGLLHNGTLVFGAEDESNMLMDCCFYDWIRNGKNIVEKYAEDDPPVPGTEQDELLQGYLQAKYRVVAPQSCVKGAGVRCVDLLSSEELFLMDIGISHSPMNTAYSTRTIPLRQYWITGGAALPAGQHGIKSALRRLRQKGLRVDGRHTDPHQVTLIFVRTLLAEGASQYITCGDPFGGPPQRSDGAFERAPAREALSSGPSRNSPCPCGSGKRYKRCCGSRT